MLSTHQMPAEVEQIGNSGICTDESLRLTYSLEFSHTSLSNPGCLMRLLRPIILILLGAVDRFGYQLAMRHTIATQLIGDNLPRLATITSQQSSDEAHRCSPITPCLQIYINDLTILINCPPKIMLFAIDLNGPARRRRLHQCRRCRRSLDGFPSIVENRLLQI
jgi:hypothetical protein